MKKLLIALLLLSGCSNEHKETPTETQYPSEKQYSDKQIELISAVQSEKIVLDRIKYGNLEITASCLLPVHILGYHKYIVDGIIQVHDGTGRSLNYSCHLSYNGGDPIERNSWICNNLFVNGDKIK